MPGLTEHAIGFKSLADAIWLRNHVVETLEAANATEDPARRDELLTYVFVGGGYAGLEALAELQDFAADAMESYPRARLHGMRWVLVEAADRVLPEIDAELADYALRELRGRGIDIRLGDARWRRSTADSRPALDRRDAADPDRRLDRRRRPAADPQRELNLPLDERGRVPVDDHLRVEGLDSVWAIGDCAAAPDPRGGTLPADRPARGPPGPGGGPQHRRRARRRHAASPSTTAATPPSSTSAATRRSAGSASRTFRGFPAWWLARTYHMSQIPGAARKARAVLDWTAEPALPPRHLRGRLDRPPEAV